MVREAPGCLLRRWRPSACTALVLFIALSAEADQGRWLLAGGRLPACSSFAGSACSETLRWPADAYEQRRYLADPSALARWREAVQSRLPESSIDAVRDVVAAVGERHSAAMSASEFARAFRTIRIERNNDIEAIDGERLYASLPDRPWNALLDFLEQRQETEDGRRPTEYVALDSSRSEAAQAIYRRLVEMAAASPQARPVVAVSTAASRDPYEALDYYSGLFRQAGAEVVWLPLDAAVRAARDAGECERLEHWQAQMLGVFDRRRLSPARFDLQQRFCRQPEAGPALLESVDALFLNGGDQSLTRAALIDASGQATPELATIRSRLAKGELVLGGTSAGTAVQSAEVMISNGSAKAAILEEALESSPPPRGCERDQSCPAGLSEDRLTWSKGGIGTFPVGILDTHFSERWRQLRLVGLLVDTGQRFGIGVDETTALEAVRGPEGEAFGLSAHGAGSVWVFDLVGANAGAGRPLDVSGVRLTRIRAGGSVRFDAGQGVDHDWPEFVRDGEPSSCRKADLDARLPDLLEAPVARTRCLDVAVDGEVLRLVLEPLARKDAVSHFLLDVRPLPRRVEGLARGAAR